jgi:hypothetical protein
MEALIPDSEVGNWKCGTKFNFAGTRYSQVNPSKIMDKDLP